jgi:hypothetical protein
MSSDADSSSSSAEGVGSTEEKPSIDQQQGWLKVGAIAATSALIGGLAAAWFYRKTLTKLHQAEEASQDTEFPAREENLSEDI